jgi:hypothetical protein
MVKVRHFRERFEDLRVLFLREGEGAHVGLGGELAEGRDRQAGGKEEGVDQPVLQLAGGVRGAGERDGGVDAQLVEDARPVGAGRAAGGADADALAVQIGERGDVLAAQRDSLEGRLVHREERAHVGMRQARGQFAFAGPGLVHRAHGHQADIMLAHLHERDVLHRAAGHFARGGDAQFLGDEGGKAVAVDEIDAALAGGADGERAGPALAVLRGGARRR